MSKNALRYCPLLISIEQMAIYFARLVASNKALRSKAIENEFRAYDKWIAMHTARCQQCNQAYLVAARKITRRIENGIPTRLRDLAS